MLEESAGRTVKWLTAQWIFYMVMMAVFLALTLLGATGNEKGAAGMILILVTLGWLGLFISPLRGLERGDFKPSIFWNLFHLPFSDHVAAIAVAAPDQQLDLAEQMLRERAKQERETRGVPNRALGIIVISIIDLIIWLVFKMWVLALINQIVGTIINTIVLSMAPTTAIKALST